MWYSKRKENIQNIDISYVKCKQITGFYNFATKYKYISCKKLTELSGMLLKSETPQCYAFEYRSLTNYNLKILEAFIKISAMSSYSLDNS